MDATSQKRIYDSIRSVIAPLKKQIAEATQDTSKESMLSQMKAKGATHYQDNSLNFDDRDDFYRTRQTKYYNNWNDHWETRKIWEYWDHQEKKWKEVPASWGFRDTHLKKIDEPRNVAEATMGKSSREIAQVEAMQNWLEPLSELLESAVAPAAKQKFIREYSIWVRTHGQFYQAALRTNPGLAEVFDAIEDSFNIQVKIQSGRSTKTAKEVRSESKSEYMTEAEGDVADDVPVADEPAEDLPQDQAPKDVDFLITFNELMDKVPSPSLKARFLYQFTRWKRQNQVEMNRLRQSSPTIAKFIDTVLAASSPSTEDNEVPNDRADVADDLKA